MTIDWQSTADPPIIPATHSLLPTHKAHPAACQVWGCAGADHEPETSPAPPAAPWARGVCSEPENPALPRPLRPLCCSGSASATHPPLTGKPQDKLVTKRIISQINGEIDSKPTIDQPAAEARRQETRPPVRKRAGSPGNLWVPAELSGLLTSPARFCPHTTLRWPKGPSSPVSHRGRSLRLQVLVTHSVQIVFPVNPSNPTAGGSRTD